LLAHSWLGPLARRRIVAPDYLRALEVLLDTIRAAGYGKQAAGCVVDIAVDAIRALAVGLKDVPPEKPLRETTGQLEMRRTLLALPEGEYPRIREAATPLTSHHRPTTYVELGIDILVKGIEAATPARKTMTTRRASVHTERLAPAAGCRLAAPGAKPITRLNALANAASER
jgi:hypothetical protein